MRLFLYAFVIGCSIDVCAQHDVDLYGKWSLISINDSEIVDNNGSHHYWIDFSKDNFWFERSVNLCGAHNWSALNGEIYYNKSIGCSKVCCDNEFSESLNYRGVYKLSNDNVKLEITNKSGVYFLERKAE